MSTIKIIIIICLLQIVGCVLNVEQEPLQKSKVKSTISGQITMLLNNIIPSAHAAEPTVCSSVKSAGSKLYAELVGLSAAGVKTVLCDTDVSVSGTYNFDLLVEDLDKRYSLVTIEVTDTRTSDERDENASSLNGRKSIIKPNDKTANLNPQDSITAHFIEKMGASDLFDPNLNPREQLEVLKTHYTPTKLQTAVPLLFQGRTLDSAESVDGVVEFLKNSLSTNFRNDLRTQVASQTPSAVTSTDIAVDLCKANPFSSHDCFKISDDCFNNDYALNWLTYGPNKDNVPGVSECATEINHLSFLHLNPPKAFQVPMGTCPMEQPVCMEENSSYNVSAICKWQQDYICYTHGARVIEDCSACSNQTLDCDSPVNAWNACCKRTDEGGCRQESGPNSSFDCNATPEHPCCINPSMQGCQ